MNVSGANGINLSGIKTDLWYDVPFVLKVVIQAVSTLFTRVLHIIQKYCEHILQMQDSAYL